MDTSSVRNDSKVELSVQPPRSLSGQVYNILKNMIIKGEVESGERLMQVQVAQKLNISRTPIREAFLMLEHDGLVERIVQGGVRVIPLSIDHINKIFEIRGVLEAYAMELACRNITTDGLDELRMIMDKAGKILRSEIFDRETTINQLLELNTLFHDRINAATGNEYLEKTIINLKEQVLRMRAIGLRRTESWIQSWDEHSQLIDYIAADRSSEAASLIKTHVANAAAHVKSVLAKD